MLDFLNNPTAVDFWARHGFVFLFFMFFFPRLTLLFSSVPFGGFFWWLGWIFAPRLLVAILASITYMQTNPILVVISWFWAIGLEGNEKRFAWKIRRHKPIFQRPNFRSENSKRYGDDVIDVEMETQTDHDTKRLS
jgi:hypothetical protein